MPADGHLVEFGDDDRHVEQRPGRRPHDLRVERVDRSRREHDCVDACCFR